MVKTKDKQNIKIAKTKITETNKLRNKVHVSNEFHLKSYLACLYRIFIVKIS